VPILFPSLRTKMLSFRNPSRYSKLRVYDIDIQGWIGVKTLIFKGTVQSEDTPKIRHVAYIQFHGMEFSETQPNKKDWHPIKVKGVLWYYKTPDIAVNPVSLKCSCYDSRFRFEKPMAKIKSLIGRWRTYDARKMDKEAGVPLRTRKQTRYYILGKSYVRKTPRPPAGLPYMNPDNIPGYCKHVFSLAMFLKKSKMAI